MVKIDVNVVIIVLIDDCNGNIWEYRRGFSKCEYNGDRYDDRWLYMMIYGNVWWLYIW